MGKFKPEIVWPAAGGNLRIGVLALQGSVEEHIRSLKRLGVEAVPVRKAEQIQELDGLILPGGESTTLGKLMRLYGIDQAICERVSQGMPLYGTCAGMILMAKEITGGEAPHLGLIDVAVSRNASGRQVDSYERDLEVSSLGEAPFRAIFIRAPYVDRVGERVQVLANVDGTPVFAREGNFLISAFHPELTDDDRVHQYFLDMVRSAGS